MSIRRIEFDDFPELYSLLTQLMTKGPLDRDRMEKAFRELLGEDTVRIGVFDDGQELLGMVTVSVHATLHHFGRVAIVDEMVVTENARGQGVGKALMNWAKEQAIDMGADALELHSAEFRNNAHAFYEALGFQHKGSVFSTKL
jgi:GNAT superfamily N-acetyltransferase